MIRNLLFALIAGVAAMISSQPEGCTQVNRHVGTHEMDGLEPAGNTFAKALLDRYHQFAATGDAFRLRISTHRENGMVYCLLIVANETVDWVAFELSELEPSELTKAREFTVIVDFYDRTEIKAYLYMVRENGTVVDRGLPVENVQLIMDRGFSRPVPSLSAHPAAATKGSTMRIAFSPGMVGRHRLSLVLNDMLESVIYLE